MRLMVFNSPKGEIKVIFVSYPKGEKGRTRKDVSVLAPKGVKERHESTKNKETNGKVD